jgi:hypothetical protein
MSDATTATKTRPRDPVAGVIIRNLDEVEMALINGRITRRMDRTGVPSEWDFFRFAWMALFNDGIARSVRVFDKSKHAHEFWFIHHARYNKAESAMAQYRIDRHALDGLTRRLKHVRDRTIAHIDRSLAIDPKEIWREAGIERQHLQCGLMSVRRVVLRASPAGRAGVRSSPLRTKWSEAATASGPAWQLCRFFVHPRP